VRLYNILLRVYKNWKKTHISFQIINKNRILNKYIIKKSLRNNEKIQANVNEKKIFKKYD
jgi:hypothetical protein